MYHFKVHCTVPYSPLYHSSSVQYSGVYSVEYYVEVQYSGVYSVEYYVEVQEVSVVRRPISRGISCHRGGIRSGEVNSI